MSILEELQALTTLEHLHKLGYGSVVASDLCFVLGRGAAERLRQELEQVPFRSGVQALQTFDLLQEMKMRIWNLEMRLELWTGRLQLATPIGSVCVKIVDDKPTNSFYLGKYK